VLVNLVQNAIDAIRDAECETREIWVRASRTVRGHAEVSVEDSGPGMSVATVGRLYEPFFTTKANGLGMGLAISRNIAEAHHGAIFVESRAAGSGTVVRVHLPLEEAT